MEYLLHHEKHCMNLLKYHLHCFYQSNRRFPCAYVRCRPLCLPIGLLTKVLQRSVPVDIMNIAKRVAQVISGLHEKNSSSFHDVTMVSHKHGCFLLFLANKIKKNNLGISSEPRVRTSPNFLCMLHVAAARTSSGGAAIPYVLPVL